MRQSRAACLIFSALITLSAGCESQHQKNKKAAAERWQSARAQLTTEAARQQLQAGELQKAALTAQGVLERSPNYAPACLVLGEIYLEQNQLALARQHLAKCLSLDPANAEAHYHLGVIAERELKHDAALEHYQQAWQARPTQSAYLLAVVDAYAALGQRQQALDFLQAHLDQADRDASLYLAAGRLLADLHRQDAAVDMFRQAHQLQPDALEATEALALALLRTGHPDQAAPLFEELINAQTDPKNPAAWVYYLGLGDCRMALGDYHQAQRCFEQLCDRHPTSVPAWCRQARAALAAQKLDRARWCVDHALSLQPNDLEARILLGTLALKQQNYAQARRLFTQLAAEQPDNALVHCLLGQALEGSDAPAQARQAYARALELAPDDPLARQLWERAQAAQLGAAGGPQAY